jgi:hypothetical protein
MKALLTAAGLLSIITSTALGAASAAEPARDSGAAKYCVRLDSEPSTRVRRTECRTKADWKRLGIDIDEELANANHSDRNAQAVADQSDPAPPRA